jgi:hypothetical protein
MFAVEFGSRKRGDCDASSDRDILLIGSDWCELRSEKERRKKEGYSVSCFTVGRAKRLIGSGSLFFKHIIDEGSLVSGSREEYGCIIAEWYPAASYDIEIENNLDWLEVLGFVPKTQAGLVIVVDIVITSVRNILIRRLAGAGEYVFSWGALLGTAVRRKLIKAVDVEGFLMARMLKNEYRQGRICNISVTFVDRLMEGAKAVFGRRQFYRFARRKNINLLPEKCVDGTYKQLRALELLCAQYNFDPSLKVFLDWVREPSYFTAHGPNKPIKPTQAA